MEGFGTTSTLSRNHSNKFKLISIDQSRSKTQSSTDQSECRWQHAKWLECWFKFIPPSQLTCNYIRTTQRCHHDVTPKKRTVLLSAARWLLSLSLSLLHLEPNFSLLFPVSTNHSKTFPLANPSCSHGDDRPVLPLQPAPQTQLYRTVQLCQQLFHEQRGPVSQQHERAARLLHRRTLLGRH